MSVPHTGRLLVKVDDAVLVAATAGVPNHHRDIWELVEAILRHAGLWGALAGVVLGGRRLEG